ncbi:MAG: DNA mismatch endonuclease Vsr [Treponema sp.]|nr:DNA mismatch endonuclease Vsr [Spirochaetia bacterium]MDD7458621.1 DNA mismatch endonuclease Vsr [Spirochaetales bacterium]MDY5810709.1 DNA mismatch endonuclease Vsr [Treponema sp.]MEE1181811.1 DNA mismatch endonuclease Vsr [Treponema sp.]
MDILSAENRHKNMSHIRSKDTKPEKQIRSALFKAGFRFRIYDRRYPGKPNLILPRYYAVIFINGCFWHAHSNCPYFVFPKSNKDFWQKKFKRNTERDQKVLDYYRNQCWRICVVWECALRGKNSKQKKESVTEKIIHWLDYGEEDFLEIRGNKLRSLQ